MKRNNHQFTIFLLVILALIGLLWLGECVSGHDTIAPVIAFGLVLFLAWASYRASSKSKEVKIPKDFDSDNGIGWRGENEVGEILISSGEFVLLASNLVVHEAEALCSQLHDAGIAFRVEGDGVHGATGGGGTFSFGGLASRMRIWIKKTDLIVAKTIADKTLKTIA